MTDRAAELCDVLQLCLTFATSGSPEQQAAVIRDGRAALDELRQLLASRQWPRVVRGGLPPGPHFLQLDDRALTGLLADIQDAYGELQERLHTAEARLRNCQDRPAGRTLRIVRRHRPARGQPVTEPPRDQAGHGQPHDDGEAREPQVVIRLRIPGPVPRTAAPARRDHHASGDRGRRLRARRPIDDRGTAAPRRQSPPPRR